MLRYIHEIPRRRYYLGESMIRKVLKVGSWWPLVFKDGHTWAKCCNVFHRVRRTNDIYFISLIRLTCNHLKNSGLRLY